MKKSTLGMFVLALLASLWIPATGVAAPVVSQVSFLDFDQATLERWRMLELEVFAPFRDDLPLQDVSLEARNMPAETWDYNWLVDDFGGQFHVIDAFRIFFDLTENTWSLRLGGDAGDALIENGLLPAGFHGESVYVRLTGSSGTYTATIDALSLNGNTSNPLLIGQAYRIDGLFDAPPAGVVSFDGRLRMDWAHTMNPGPSIHVEFIVVPEPEVALSVLAGLVCLVGVPRRVYRDSFQARLKAA